MKKRIKKFVKTGLLLGIGAAYLTKEKVDKFSKKVLKAANQGNINEREARKTLNNFLGRAKQEHKRVEHILKTAIKDVAKPYRKKINKKR